MSFFLTPFSSPEKKNPYHMRNMNHIYRCFGSPLRQGNTDEKKEEKKKERKGKNSGKPGCWCYTPGVSTVPACQAQICSLAKIDRSTNARLHLATVATHGILFLLFRVQVLGRNTT